MPANSDTTSNFGGIPLGTAGTGDSNGVFDSFVIKNGSNYLMQYGGIDGSGTWRIFRATSPDGINWTKTDNSIPPTSDTTNTNGRIGLGNAGRGDSRMLSSPTVVRESNIYRMYYAASDASNVWRIYYATSADGLTWTKYDNTIPANSDKVCTNGRIPLGTGTTADNGFTADPDVIKEDGMFRMWYDGYNGGTGRVLYATSVDGVTWIKFNNASPANSDTVSTDGRLPLGSAGRGDANDTYGSSILKDDGVYKLWYTGLGANDTIYYATMTPVPIGQKTDYSVKAEGVASQRFGTGKTLVGAQMAGVWQMEETGGNGAWIKDGTANANHGTPANLTVVDGIFGTAKSFNGTTSNITIPDNDTLDFVATDNFTIEMWFKHNGTISGSNDYLLSKYNGRGYKIYMTSTGLMYFGIDDDSSFGPDDYARYTTKRYDDNQWHHLAVRKIGTTNISLFLDGALMGRDTSISATGTLANTAPLYIGVDSNGTSNEWDGIIDEVRITRLALTDDEIAENASLGGNRQFSVILPTTDFNGKSRLPFFVASDRVGNYMQMIWGEDPFVNYEPDNNTLRLWNMEEGTSSVNTDWIKDAGSYRNHGRLGGGTASRVPAFVEGQIGKGRYFDGSGDVITSTLVTDPGNVNTIDFWMNPVGTITSKTIATNITTNSSGQLVYGSCTTPSPIVANQWSHVAVISNGVAVCQIYLNGQLVSTGTTGVTYGTTGNIGATSSGFQGTIDEFRISDVVRTPEQIRQTFEYQLRLHRVSIDFSTKLNTSDVTGTSEATAKTDTSVTLANNEMINKIFIGENLVIRENFNGTEYDLTGIVTSVDTGTREVTVANWGGSVPNQGTANCGGSNTYCFSNNASVFKWQREFVDLGRMPADQKDAVTRMSVLITDGTEGRNFWLDDFKSISNYLSDPTGSPMVSTPQRYVQYRFIPTTSDVNLTPYIQGVTFQTTYNLSITGGSSTQTMINDVNKTAFNIQCNGAYAPEPEVITCQASFDGINWYPVGMATGPFTGATIQGNPNITAWTGFPADGTNIPIYVRTTNGTLVSNIASFNVDKNTGNPVIISITSVEGDATAPYIDTTDNGETTVVYVASPDAVTCRWSETDMSYSSMPNICASTSQCVLNLTGNGDKTVYFRCIDSGGNSTTPGFALNYQILHYSYLTFTVNTVGSGQSVNGATTTKATSGNKLDFGTMTPSVSSIIAHDLLVSTNGAYGYQVTIQNPDGVMRNSTAITPFTGTNASPLTWTSPSGSTHSYIGYTTEDTSLFNSPINRFATNKWAGLNSSLGEVSYHNGSVTNQTTRVGFRSEVDGVQNSGKYTGTVMYICTATF